MNKNGNVEKTKGRKKGRWIQRNKRKERSNKKKQVIKLWMVVKKQKNRKERMWNKYRNSEKTNEKKKQI